MDHSHTFLGLLDIPVRSTLLSASLCPMRVGSNAPGQSFPLFQSLNKLSTVSAFYLYVNPPPMGYETPAPKVAESVLRAWEFNTNREKTVNIDKYIVNKACIERDRDIPLTGVTGNYHPGAAYLMYKAILA